MARAENAERDLGAAKAEAEAKDEAAATLQARIQELESELENADTGGSDSKSK